jgi:hypothetical protein
MNPREKNWEWIRKRFELGFTLGQISDKYAEQFPGESISRQRIGVVARKEKWKRDLSERYEKAVARKVIEKTDRAGGVDGAVDKAPRDRKSDDETVDEAAEVAAEAVYKHRRNADELRAAAMRIIREVDANEPFTVVTKDGSEVQLQDDVTKRAQALTNASRSLTAAVDIERKSLALDRKDGDIAKTGTFNVYTNVPDPEPVPPGI